MVKFLGLYDAWSSFLGFAPSIHRPVGGIDEKQGLKGFQKSGWGIPSPQQLPGPRPRGRVGKGINPFPGTGIRRLGEPSTRLEAQGLGGFVLRKKVFLRKKSFT